MNAASSTLRSQFFYRAMKPSGSAAMGFRAAADQSQLEEDLKRDDLLLLGAWKLPLGTSRAPRFP